MEQTLREHIGRLEAKIVNLKKQLRDADVAVFQRTELELDLANAEQALQLFHKAYELEQSQTTTKSMLQRA
jgi:hypothetical protein